MHYAEFAILFALLAPGAGAASRSDFSGTWTMDPARSESAHQDGTAEASTLTIRVTGKDLAIETTRGEAGKAPVFHELLKFRLDGSETASVGDAGVEVTGKARWDGAKLVVETVRNIQDSTVTTLYVHTLSANGREMTIDKTLTVQHGYMGRTAPTNGHGKDVFVRAAK